MSDLVHHAAMHALYVEHHRWLKGWLRKRMNCSEQAADLAHDTFLRVLGQRKVETLREPRAYLGRIARGLLIDMFRRRSLEQAYLETLAAIPEALDISPEERLLIIEALLEIDQLLDSLGSRTREVFLMAQLDGMSYVEIGQRLQISVNTVRKHAVRALTQCLLSMED